MESNENIITDLKNQNKELLRNNRALNDKLELNNKNKQTEYGGLEKKVDKLLEEKERLQ